MKTREKWGLSQKMRFPRKNLLRPPGDIRRYPLTGGADGNDSERRRDPEGSRKAEIRKAEENQRQERAGAPTKIRRTWSNLSHAL
jgi:hypothetical protein